VKGSAIYPGTFDPVTFGHLDLIKRASKIFNHVTVAVANNPNKKKLFSVDERVDMLKAVTKSVSNVSVDSFEGLVIKYARRKKIKVMIRGLRAISDFEYELHLALTNRRLAENIETVFLMPSEGHQFVSSALIKEGAMLGADLSTFVPSYVEKKLRVKIKALSI
jgi:pantetheine-phosphate adenylyltransferase